MNEMVLMLVVALWCNHYHHRGIPATAIHHHNEAMKGKLSFPALFPFIISVAVLFQHDF